jgi:hypothetical protein
MRKEHNKRHVTAILETQTVAKTIWAKQIFITEARCCCDATPERMTGL